MCEDCDDEYSNSEKEARKHLYREGQEEREVENLPDTSTFQEQMEECKILRMVEEDRRREIDRLHFQGVDLEQAVRKKLGLESDAQETS